MADKLAISKIKRALTGSKVLNLYRDDIDGYGLSGFPVAVSEEIVVLNVLNESLDLDGYVAVRTPDITDVSSSKNAFYQNVLARRGQKRQMLDDCEVTDLHSLITYLQKDGESAFTINEWVKNEELVSVGTCRLLTPTHLVLNLISPSGKIEGPSDPIKLSAISEVGFAGGYEDALSGYAFKKGAKVHQPRTARPKPKKR